MSKFFHSGPWDGGGDDDFISSKGNEVIDVAND